MNQIYRLLLCLPKCIFGFTLIFYSKQYIFFFCVVKERFQTSRIGNNLRNRLKNLFIRAANRIFLIRGLLEIYIRTVVNVLNIELQSKSCFKDNDPLILCIKKNSSLFYDLINTHFVA